jgi:hypothetical protein
MIVKPCGEIIVLAALIMWIINNRNLILFIIKMQQHSLIKYIWGWAEFFFFNNSSIRTISAPRRPFAQYFEPSFLNKFLWMYKQASVLCACMYKLQYLWMYSIYKLQFLWMYIQASVFVNVQYIQASVFVNVYTSFGFCECMYKLQFLWMYIHTSFSFCECPYKLQFFWMDIQASVFVNVHTSFSFCECTVYMYYKLHLQCWNESYRYMTFL